MLKGKMLREPVQTNSINVYRDTVHAIQHWLLNGNSAGGHFIFVHLTSDTELNRKVIMMDLLHES